MVAIHIEHKLDAGILTMHLVHVQLGGTDLDPSDEPGVQDDQPSDVFRFQFESDETGVMFDADYTRADFVRICSILGESDELLEMLNVAPSVMTEVDGHIVDIRFVATGRKKTYPVELKLVRRTYTPDKQDTMELRAENAVLRRKVASLEDDLADVRELCEQFRMDIAHLAILANNTFAYRPVELPDGNMSNDALLEMMKPICTYRDAIDSTHLLNVQDETIVRAIDRGVDPNKIIGRKDSQTPGMPLLFRILHDANVASDIDRKIDCFIKALKLIKYLISVGVDVNIKYEDKTILTRFIEYDAQYPSYSTNWTEFNAFSPVSVQCMMTNPIRGQHYSAYPGRGLGKCIEYIEVRNAILKTLRDAGAK